MYDIRLKKRKIYNCRNILVHVSLVEIWDESWRYKNGWKLIGYRSLVCTPYMDLKQKISQWADGLNFTREHSKKLVRWKLNLDKFNKICEALESNVTRLDIKGSRVYKGLRGFLLIREENYDTRRPVD